MPYIQAKLSKEFSEAQKNELQQKLADVVAAAFSKPKNYIMTTIEDNSTIYMGCKKADNGAYLAISLFGSAAKSACQTLTKEICNILENYGIESSAVYITYHPVDLWGWNGMMF